MLNDVIKVTYPFIHSFLDYPSNSEDCVTINFIGCSHNCDNCHSVELQDYDYEHHRVFGVRSFIEEILHQCNRMRTRNVVFMGGDPFFVRNREAVIHVCTKLKQLGCNICIYTGYDLDYVKRLKFSSFDFIKCGRYIKELHQLSYKNDDEMCLASSNQVLADKDFNVISENGIYKFKK